MRAFESQETNRAQRERTRTRADVQARGKPTAASGPMAHLLKAIMLKATIQRIENINVLKPSLPPTTATGILNQFRPGTIRPYAPSQHRQHARQNTTTT